MVWLVFIEFKCSAIYRDESPVQSELLATPRTQEFSGRTAPPTFGNIRW
jgi:hypothetical protein